MKTYTVHIPYTTYLEIKVQANSEEEAIKAALQSSKDPKYDEQFLANADGNDTAYII
jgi:hypothetical protein